MSYPTDNRSRAAYWRKHIDFSTKQLEPWFQVGRRMTALYENEASTFREQWADNTDLGAQNVSRAKPSMVFGWIDQTVANMLSANPKFRVQAKRKDSQDGELTVSRVVNYWYEETEQLHQDRRILQDAFLYPFGVKKLGWTADVGNTLPITSQTDIVFDDPEEENLFLAAGEFTAVTEEQDHVEHRRSHGELLSDPTIDQDIKDNVIKLHIAEHDEIENRGQPDAHTDIQEEAPFGLRWAPEDFRIDPLAKDGLKDARWIAFKSCKPIDEVRSNPNYNRAAVNRLEPQRAENAPVTDKLLGDDDGFGLVTLWEIWARNFPTSTRRRRNMIIVLAEQGNGDSDVILRHEDEWPYDRIRPYPCEMLSFGFGNKTWLQKPILALAGFDNIQSLSNEVLDSILGVIRKQKNVILYDSDILQENEVELALAAPESTAIPVPGLSRVGAAAVVPMPFLQIPGDKGGWLELIQSLADRAAGSPQPLASESDTATEAAITERRTTAREGLRKAIFEQFQVCCAEKFWQLHTQFRPSMEVLIDPDAAEWSDVDDATAKGMYRFEIDVSSAQTGQALERKQWLDLLNLLSGMVEVSVATGQQPPNLAKVAEQLMTRGYGISNPADLWPAIDESEGPQPMGQGVPMGPQNMIRQMPSEPGMNGGPVRPQQFGAPAPSEAAMLADSVRV